MRSALLITILTISKVPTELSRKQVDIIDRVWNWRQNREKLTLGIVYSYFLNKPASWLGKFAAASFYDILYVTWSHYTTQTLTNTVININSGDHG